MRMFTHHALKTPAARPLNDWLAKAGPVSSLMQTARELASLEAEVMALLPPAMRAGVAVAGVRQDARSPGQPNTLVLLAAHGAAAARVRQIVPSLLARLQQRGARIDAVRVRVQPDPARGGWEVEPAPRKPRAPTPAIAVDSMAALEQSLPDSPLRDAVRALVERHRGR
ncbi:DciA family protein [Cupriavidus sp. AU9028]|uniref:DciA family protein n=1 Tax=Cupriavidus sp. AU9028 TaxID=2871157 RepID=UPI001C9464B6|nr:DciA family protein [Cupriavidus sp. AU9028]MBY4897448.1 DciA family protein [Cupriavidus sp. AU9028]